MHPTLHSQLVEQRQSEMRRIARPGPVGDSAPRRRRTPWRALGLVLVRVGERLAGPEVPQGRRATVS